MISLEGGLPMPAAIELHLQLRISKAILLVRISLLILTSKLSIGGKTNIAKILMENELATANETGTHPSVLEKNLNGSISNKHVKIGGGGFGPNHFQSSFSL
jgi:hypothetical protein